MSTEIWFGSSVGVAISNLPGGEVSGSWLKNGWHVTLVFILGFAALQLALGWHPHPPPKTAPAAAHREVRP